MVRQHFAIFALSHFLLTDAVHFALTPHDAANTSAVIAEAASGCPNRVFIGCLLQVARAPLAQQNKPDFSAQRRKCPTGAAQFGRRKLA